MSEEIFSSTGDLGESVRQDNRWYSNSPPVTSTGIIEDDFLGIVSRGREYSEEISRVVRRGVVSSQVMNEILNGSLRCNLEVALPLGEIGQEGWLTYLSLNDEARVTPQDIQTVIKETAPQERSVSLDVVAKNFLTHEGAEVHSSIENVDQLLEMWGPVFGWEYDQISALKTRLIGEDKENSPDRSVWFVGLHVGGVVVSAAMAERITIEGIEGQPLDLVESTEWCSRNPQAHDSDEDFRGRGFMGTVLSCLNSAIIDHFRSHNIDMPLIYAECNYTSRSDRVGNGVGFVIPSREHANQFIEQNVVVNDGLSDDPLRDFSFMYLGSRVINSVYSTEFTDRALNIVGDRR